MGFQFLARVLAAPQPAPFHHQQIDPCRRDTPCRTADALVSLYGPLDAIRLAQDKAIIRSPRTLRPRELAPHRLAELDRSLPPGPEAAELRFWLDVLRDLHGRAMRHARRAAQEVPQAG